MYFGLKGQSVPTLFYCWLPAQKLPSYLLRLVSLMEAGRLGLRGELHAAIGLIFFGPTFRSSIANRLVTTSFWVLLCTRPSNDHQSCLPYIQRSSQFRYAAKHPTLLWLLILRQPMWSDHTWLKPFFYLFYLLLSFFLDFRLFDCVLSCKWVYKCWDLLSLSLFPSSCFPPCDTVVQRNSVQVW